MFFSYLRLRFKQCAFAFIKIVGVLLVLSLMLLMLFKGVMTALSAKSISLVKVGMVIPAEETTTRYASSFIESMDSVSSICEFKYLDEREALQEFKEGKLQAVVVIPQGFFHDVQVGLNPPATLYFPEDPGIVGYTFKEVILSGVSLLQTAEAGVYAALDTSRAYEAKLSAADIGNSLALKYAGELLSRDKIFDDTVVSALGNMTLLQYYIIAGFVTVMSFCGVGFKVMYGQTSKTVSERLRVRGLNVVAESCLKILAMFPYIFCLGTMIYITLCLAFTNAEEQLVTFNLKSIGCIALMSITMALYFQLVYGITGNGRAGVFVLIVFNVIGASVSGLIIPVPYLSHWVSYVGMIFPMRYWTKLLTFAFYSLS